MTKERILNTLRSILWTHRWSRPANGVNFQPEDTLATILPDFSLQAMVLALEIELRFQVKMEQLKAKIKQGQELEKVEEMTLGQLADLIGQKLEAANE